MHCNGCECMHTAQAPALLSLLGRRSGGAEGGSEHHVEPSLLRFSSNRAHAVCSLFLLVHHDLYFNSCGQPIIAGERRCPVAAAVATRRARRILHDCNSYICISYACMHAKAHG